MANGYPQLESVIGIKLVKEVVAFEKGGIETSAGIPVPPRGQRWPPRGRECQYSLFWISEILRTGKVETLEQLAFTVDRTGVGAAGVAVVGVAILSKTGEELYSTLSDKVPKRLRKRGQQAPVKEALAFSPKAAEEAAKFFKPGNLLAILTEPVRGPAIVLGARK